MDAEGPVQRAFPSAAAATGDGADMEREADRAPGLRGARRRFVFGSLWFDADNGLLHDHDGERALTPLGIRVLRHLLEHAGAVVSKQELIEACWEESFVSDDSLVHVISELRQSLGDDPREPHYIQTLSRRGYRFIAEVAVENAEDSIEPPTSPAKDAAGPGLVRTWWPPSPRHTAGTILVVVILTAILSSRLWYGGPAGERPSIRSLAVIPFANLMDDPAEDYFVLGIHDALITDLSRIGSLQVISRTSALRYRNTDKTIPEIASELGVDAVIEGSVLRSGGRVRITAQLIDGATDDNIWADSYERDLQDIVGLVGELARTIGSAVEVQVVGAPVGPTDFAPRVDAAAHDAFLRGRYAMIRLDRPSLEEAIERFEEAVRIAPDYAGAWAELASAHFWLGGLGHVSGNAEAEQARHSASRALELDDQSSEAHAVLGWLALYFEWDWQAAAEHFRTALEINPNDAMARHGYADYLAAMGEVEESLAQVQSGLRSDPFSPLAVVPAVGHLFFVHDYSVAESTIRDAQRSFPPLEPLQEWLPLALWELDRRDEAVAAWLADLPAQEKTGLQAAFADGDADAALAWLAARAAERAEAGESGPFTAATWLAWSGDVDGAFAWLDRAYREHAPTLFLVRVDPRFDLLHGDRRYADLLARLGLSS